MSGDVKGVCNLTVEERVTQEEETIVYRYVVKADKGAWGIIEVPVPASGDSTRTISRLFDGAGVAQAIMDEVKALIYRQTGIGIEHVVKIGDEETDN